MSSTWRGSISIEIPEDGTSDGGSPRARWARVELEDFFWIGRCSICNLRIRGDTQVSRLQATIHRDGDGYLLADMQSRNGTSVNGRPIKAVRLIPGDRVKVGRTLFEFEPDRKQDTVFHQGTSRVVGAADVELKSFPCSIQLSDDGGAFGRLQISDDGGAFGRQHQDRVQAAGGFVMREVTPSSAGPSAALGSPGPRVSPHASSLEEFLTIVVDRLVCELQASLVLLYVPPVAAREAITVARGLRDGKLEVLAASWDAVHRVAVQLEPCAMGEPVPDEGERLIWRAGEVHRRLAPGESAPRRLDHGAAFTVALPRVGRPGTQEPGTDPTRGMAWLHVEESRVARNVASLVEEVASAVNVSVIRFLERGSA